MATSLFAHTTVAEYKSRGPGGACPSSSGHTVMMCLLFRTLSLFTTKPEGHAQDVPKIAKVLTTPAGALCRLCTALYFLRMSTHMSRRRLTRIAAHGRSDTECGQDERVCQSYAVIRHCTHEA